MRYIFIISLVLSFLFTSCVSQKKYDELALSRNNLQTELTKLRKAKRDCDEMLKEKERLEQDYKSIMNQREDLQSRYKNLEKANNDLLDKYDELLAQNSNIVSSSSKEKKQLSEELAQKETELNRKEKELKKTDEKLAAKQTELEDLRSSLESLRASLQEREVRIANLTNQLNAQKNVLTQLKSRLSDALLGFSANDLTVTQKNGKVYVSLSQNLLFAKGSDQIDTKGREAIQKVSTVLAQNPDIQITVEGHTDTDGTAERNWDLSVTRATSVINIMTKSGVDPKRITAAGRGYYAPVAANDSEENKSLNRRTEIILSPKLDELFRMLNE